MSRYTDRLLYTIAEGGEDKEQEREEAAIVSAVAPTPEPLAPPPTPEPEISGFGTRVLASGRLPTLKEGFRQYISDRGFSEIKR